MNATVPFPSTDLHFLLASGRVSDAMKGTAQAWRVGQSPFKLHFAVFRRATPSSAALPDSMPEESPQQAADRLVVARVARGEPIAFAELYDRLSGPLYSLCLRMTGEAQEAEDILQEACLVIWRRAASYDPERSSVFSWAVHLTRCKAIDHLRSRGRRLRVVLPAGSVETTDGDGIPTATEPAAIDEAPTAADQLDRSNQAVRVRRVLDALPAEQSQVIEMAFFGDLSHHEISARLSQPLGTIKARIRRGLLKLRDGLKGGGAT